MRVTAEDSTAPFFCNQDRGASVNGFDDQNWKMLRLDKRTEVRNRKKMSGDTFHVHVMISIPPKYAVAQIIDFIKGKSAIQIARNFVGRKKNFTGQHFWVRGYHVSTVGRDEEAIRKYKKEDRRIDQLNLFDE